VSWEEFRTGMRRLYTRSQMSSNAIMDAFKRFDHDGNGLLEGEELRALVKETFQIDTAAKSRILRFFDANRDQNITFQEFRDCVERYGGNIGEIIWRAMAKTKRHSTGLRSNRGMSFV
jgi:Ca2+-binding EF-hand superfamily protein